MPYTERSKPQVVLNKMTKAVYDSIEKDPDQLYAVTDAEVYSLPTASADTLGGIKVGNNLSITEDGTLSAEAGGDAVYDTNGVNITDTTGTRIKIGSGAITYANGVAIGVSAQAGKNTTQRRSVAIGNEAQALGINSVAVGPYATTSKDYSVSVGQTATTYGASDVAIGQNASVSGANSVALGANSYAEDANIVSVGDPGYEPDGVPSYYRKIVCVEDGTDAHDAATVGQMPKERSLTQAEYDALSEEEKMNGTTYYITDASNRQNDVYSTSEQPIGTWVDGKTIYRKTVAFGSLPNATLKTVAHGISNLGYVVKIEGSCLQSTEYKNIPLMYRGADSTYNVEFAVDATYIKVSSNQDRAFITCPYVTIYYTKN